jgi:hypothetical protein
MLRAKERAPTPLSIVFIFGLAIESIKELGGASKNVLVQKNLRTKFIIV